MAFLGEVSQFLAQSKDDAVLAPYLGGLQSALGHLQQASVWLSRNGLADPDNAGAASTDYMHLLGLTGLGYMWARMVKAVLARQARGESTPGLDAKLTLAKFFSERMLPETGAHLARLSAGAAALMALPAEAF
jgi:poly(3-hydroxybutyrate) depolymerase